MEEPIPEQKNRPKIRQVIIITVGVLIVSVGVVVLFIENYYKNRIFEGVYIGRLDLSGLTPEQAQKKLEEWQSDWWSKQMQYNIYDENNAKITSVDFYPLAVSEGGALSYQFISFDLKGMTDLAFKQGRSDFFIKQVINRLKIWYRPVRLEALVSVDEKQLNEFLHLKLKDFETLPKEASFTIAGLNSEPVIVKETPGNTFDYQAAIIKTKERLRQLNDNAITINRSYTEPIIKSRDVEIALEKWLDFKQLFPIKLYYWDERIDFQRQWNLAWNNVYQSAGVVTVDNQARLSLNSEKLDDFWLSIERLVNVEAQDAKFSIGEGNRVEQFQPSQTGFKLDRQTIFIKLQDWLWLKLETNQQTEDMLALTVNTIAPKVSTADVNDLGITEIIGVGYSNFAGSPKNRVHNIKIGAVKLNGLLIAPDEEFSLLKNLRPFDETGGYLPELVIKGDKIIPEVGGGLCQIGSTTFRAAMKSGLNITYRRNHSLVVSYYNDHRNGNPGTDATIYDPAPDFRFINDTGNHVLIQTAITPSTGDLIFTFWGTSDGRKGEYTQPVVSKWIPAGEPIYNKTTDLKPGEEKCQSEHKGAKASFTYQITHADGSLVEKIFESEYRPLPKICLVGIEPEEQAVECVEGTETECVETKKEIDEQLPVELLDESV